jgi:hypothetical protein
LRALRALTSVRARAGSLFLRSSRLIEGNGLTSSHVHQSLHKEDACQIDERYGLVERANLSLPSTPRKNSKSKRLADLSDIFKVLISRFPKFTFRFDCDVSIVACDLGARSCAAGITFVKRWLRALFSMPRSGLCHSATTPFSGIRPGQATQIFFRHVSQARDSFAGAYGVPNERSRPKAASKSATVSAI